jgi:anaerobic selenocysteine-containing dehydrogenase
MTTIRSNCPRDCYDGCGIVVTLADDKKPRVSGDPDHPVARGSLCAKCGVAYNGVFQDESARLTTPLRRVGVKGDGEFEPVSWDEALADIASRFNAIIEQHGPEAILTQNYSGTLSLIAYNFPSRLVNFLGASQVEYGTICNAAGYVAWDLLYGTHDRGFDPRTAKDSSCILVWGANPSHSAPHMHKHWLQDSPAKVVVVDPIRTTTAAEADLHLQPRPGTDAALAFGLLNALQELDAFDDTFVADHTLGFDEIAADIARCTPQRAEEQTGVAATDIRTAAAMYAAGPSLLWCGQGLQRQPLGGNIMRAAGLLPAVTGNVGKPGAGFYYLNDTAGFAGIDEGYLAGESLARGEAKEVGALDLADRLLDADEFKAYMVWNSNPLASCSDQQKLRQACSRDDLFMVAVDLFETDTVRYADIVLPAASFLEFDDIVVSYMNLSVGAQSKVIEPLGESLPNQEIFRRIAKAMKLDEPALFESDESMISAMLEQAGVGYDFAELRHRGHFFVGGEEPRVFFSDLEFDTPSGRIEIASGDAQEMGLPRVPFPGVDPEPPADKLRLLTPASLWRMNDSYANDPRLRKRAGTAELIICTEDATRLGIGNGDAVEVAGNGSTLQLTAQVDDIVQPGTVVSYKGRWPSQEPGAANTNFLHEGRKCDMGESTSVHGTLVSVAPA